MWSSEPQHHASSLQTARGLLQIRVAQGADSLSLFQKERPVEGCSHWT